MTDADLQGLRSWAESHLSCGSVQARQVLALLAERDALRAFALAAADRIHAQSQLLSKRAEVKGPKA